MMSQRLKDARLGDTAQIHYVEDVGWFAFAKGSKEAVFLTMERNTSHVRLHLLAVERCARYPRDARSTVVFSNEVVHGRA